jgi:peptide/nickel transport system substrate-binding protein
MSRPAGIERRRRWRSEGRRPRAAWLVAALCGAAALAVAPGLAQSRTTAAAGPSLHLAFSFDQGSLDPDVFYGSEELEITTSCYEGLLRYGDNSTTIQPWLAKSYTVSNGSKTYTFHLRPNVKFVDGTPFTSSAMKYDFERRKAVNAGPAYMVAPIKSMQTPNPLTLVVNLTTPVDPFTSWLASPYGTKAVSPALVKAHATKSDPLAKKWLATHCAGTGPYTLSKVVPTQQFVLSANPGYWGKKPYYTTIEYDVIPDFSTQELKLKSGELDFMTHGIPSRDVPSFQSDSKFTVLHVPAIGATNLWLNAHKPALANPAVRKAIGEALNRALLVKSVYGSGSVVNPGFFSPGALPAKYGGVYKLPYDLAAAKAVLDKLPSSDKSLSFNYTTDDAANQQLAGLVAAELRAAGLNVTLRGIPITEVFSYPTYPDSKRPDGLIVPQNPDDASPPSFPKLEWISAPTSGTYFRPIDPKIDAILNQAISQASHTRALELYGKAATMYGNTYDMVPISNNLTTVVTKKGITGFASERQGAWTIRLAELHAG